MPENKNNKNKGKINSPDISFDNKDNTAPPLNEDKGSIDTEDVSIQPRPTLQANIKRHIFTVPKETSQNPNIISDEPIQSDDEVKIDDKTKQIFSNSAKVKRTSFKKEINNGISTSKKDVADIDEDDVVSEKTRNIIPSHEQKKKEGERQLEAELKKSRQEAKKGFVLESENIPYTRDLPSPPETDIFQISNKNRRLATKHLLHLKKIQLLKTSAISIIGLILLFLAFLPSNSNGSEFANRYMNFVFLNFALLFVAAGISQSELLDGFKAIKNLSPNFNSFISLMWSGAILQSIVFLSQPSVIATGLQLSNAAAVILSLPAFIARYINIKRALKHLLSLSSRDEISVVGTTSNDEIGYEAGKGVINEESCIHYNAKTKSLNNFIDNILKSDPAKNLYNILFIVFISASFLLALILYIKERDIYAAVTALALCLSAVMPSSLTLSLAFLIFSDNIELNKNRAAVLSFEAAEACAESNFIILNAEDIFPSDSCDVHGIVPYNKMRIDTAIIYAAAILANAGGPLSGLFNSIILERDDILPEVESPTYEDKLGLSAWIDDKIILLGTLDHLKHHNVKLPSGNFYGRHCIGDRKPLFLAVEGVLAAMFVVSYYGDEDIIKELKKLTNNGVSLLVATSDPNIGEDFIENSLGLEQNTVKVMNQKMAEAYKGLKNNISPTTEAGSFHDGSTLSFLKTINASSNIISKKNLSIAAILAFSLISLLLMSIFLFAKGGIVKIGSIQILIFHVFWNALGLIVPKIIALLPKR